MKNSQVSLPKEIKNEAKRIAYFFDIDHKLNNMANVLLPQTTINHTCCKTIILVKINLEELVSMFYNHTI